MNHLQEKGVLPFGYVDPDTGECHRDFELRPLKVKDVLETAEGPHAERAILSERFRAIVQLALRLEKLGGLPREKITPEVLLDLYDDDLAAILAADKRLTKRLEPFRGSAEGAEESGALSDGNGVHTS